MISKVSPPDIDDLRPLQVIVFGGSLRHRVKRRPYFETIERFGGTPSGKQGYAGSTYMLPIQDENGGYFSLRDIATSIRSLCASIAANTHRLYTVMDWGFSVRGYGEDIKWFLLAPLAKYPNVQLPAEVWAYIQKNKGATA